MNHKSEISTSKQIPNLNDQRLQTKGDSRLRFEFLMIANCLGFAFWDLKFLFVTFLSAPSAVSAVKQ